MPLPKDQPTILIKVNRVKKITSLHMATHYSTFSCGVDYYCIPTLSQFQINT